uniref:Uncharacterized protein n=1 Tax=Medicago truncatula TaxID=3880 RepID=I3SAR5_MEDTR|nr:unknown [Medicago truncatula]
MLQYNIVFFIQERDSPYNLQPDQKCGMSPCYIY